MGNGNVVLGDLKIEDWLESYRQRTAAAARADGPLNPNNPGVFAVVPGPYSRWHYDALAMFRVIEKVVEQQREIESLMSRIQELEKPTMTVDTRTGK